LTHDAVAVGRWELVFMMKACCNVFFCFGVMFCDLKTENPKYGAVETSKVQVVIFGFVSASVVPFLSPHFHTGEAGEVVDRIPSASQKPGCLYFIGI